MSKSLGVYVTSDQYMDKIIKLSKAAKKKDVDVNVFFTHVATRLCTDPRIEELERYANIALCKVGFEGNELNPEASPLDKKAYTSQSWHAEMIYDCDRYLTF